MSFKVQCAENYYGPNCTTFCEPVEGVNTCDREGRVVCTNERRDPDSNCEMCLQGWDLTTTAALQSSTPTIQSSAKTSGKSTTTVTNYGILILRFFYMFVEKGPVITSAILGGILGLSVIINIVLIVFVLLVFKKRDGPIPPSLPPEGAREGFSGPKDFEMKPNLLYDFTNQGSEGIATNLNEAYETPVPGEGSHPETYEYVNP